MNASAHPPQSTLEVAVTVDGKMVVVGSRFNVGTGLKSVVVQVVEVGLETVVGLYVALGEPL